MKCSLLDPMHLYKAIPHKAFLAVALTLAALSCGGGKIPQTRYYTLDLPPAPSPQGSTAQESVAVRPLTAASQFTQDRIVYRPSRHEVGFYEYHRWAADPRQSIHAALMDKLRSSGLFATVSAHDGRQKTDYLLQARIERLEEVDFESGVKVYVEIAAELVDASSNRVVWTGVGRGSGGVTASDVAQVVAEMSKATEASLEAIIASLRQGWK
jgi:ABC-type uncharacterized transport system auxiliary subunit